MAEGRRILQQKRRIPGYRPSRHPVIVRLRTQESRSRMRARGHKRLGLWLSGPADALLRTVRSETGMSFSEILDRLLLHPDAERAVVEVSQTAPDEPLF